MSKKGELLYHPVNGTTEQTWTGFSWPGFLFGVIWLAVKQMWVHFIVSIVILIVTAGFGGLVIWFFYGFAGNGFHKKALLSKGYLTQTQYEQRRTAPPYPGSAQQSVPAQRPDTIDQLTKLAKLRDSGVLTESEFAEEKRKLLQAA